MASQSEIQTLQLNLLGVPEVRLGDRSLSLGTAKAKALLFYLAVTSRPRSRSVLVNLLWGEMPEANARRNLTATLTSLRKELAAFLAVDSDQIAFQQSGPHQLDVAQFEEQLAQAKSSNDVRLLRKAVALVRGDFLEGLEVKDAPAFEEWVYSERERLREQMLLALQALVDQAVAQGDYAGGLDYAHQLLAMDPWREAAHRQLMTLHAQNGRRDAALFQYETCRKILAEELGVDPSLETMSLHQRLLEADAAPAHNLPPAPNSFVGRATELQQIARHLADPACRLLTIVGPGGVGKTRLAVEAARRYTDSAQSNATDLVAKDFSDGVYFITLADVVDGLQAFPTQTLAANAIVVAVAEAVGFALAGSTPPATQLLGYLAGRSMLLIGDNFEELLQGDIGQDALSLIHALLQKALNVKLLITSRVRLKLQEEWVLAIDGLSYPTLDTDLEEMLNSASFRTHNNPDERPVSWPDANWQDINLHEYTAVHLFIQRARQIWIGIQFSAKELRHVVQICRLLEGLPLGLELAANWVNDLSCAEIVAEIEQGVDILRAELYNLPSRHRSLRAVFAYSWRLLTAQEQMALCQISIFRGGFTRAAAAEVAGASLPMLARLMDKSLLRRAGDPTGVARHDMHALIRQFAQEKLRAAPSEWADSIAAHSDYFARYAQSCYARYLAGEYPDVIRAMTADSDNFHAAWTRLVERLPQKQWLKTTLATMGDFVHPLAWFYFKRARYIAGIDALRLGLSELMPIVAQLDPSDELSLGIKVVSAQIQLRLAMLLYYTGGYAESQKLVEDVLPLLESENLVREEAFALGELSKCTRRRGDYALTKQLLDRSGQLYAQIGDALGQTVALNGVAVTAADEGDYALAERAGKKVIAFYRQLNDMPNLVMTQSNLANTYIRQRQYLAAKPLLEEAYALAEKQGNLFSLVMTGTNLASVAEGLGDDEAAEAHTRQALARAREIGDRRWTAVNLNALSKIYLRRRAWKEAEQYAQDALAISHAIAGKADVMSELSSLARVWANQGELERALRLLLFVQQNPSTVQQDKDENQDLLDELTAEAPPTLLAQIADWSKAAVLDDVLALLNT